MTTKVPIELSSTPSINDGGNATAITIDSSENVTFAGTIAATSVDASAGFLNGSNGGIRIHTGGTKFFNITAANAARDNHMDIGASDARFKGLYLGNKIFIGGLIVASNDAGRIGLNRNPDDGTHISSDSVQRFQINGPSSSGDYLDFQNYDTSGNYVGGFRIEDGAIRAEPMPVSTPSYSFDNDTDTGMTRPTGDTLQFVTGGSESMRINSSGNLLINTTSDLDSGSHLQVLGSTGGGRSPVVFQNAADAGPSLSCWKTPTTTDSSARFIQFYANSDNTPMGGIVGNGASNVQFATLSDEREKENIIPVDNVLKKLMNLDIVSFDWKKHDEHVKAGFIAQNVEKHFPEYVIENISQEGEEARKGTTGGMSAGYIAVLTKAIQEQQEQIDALQSEINLLKGE